jgi:predicted nucleic acid-binding protein
MQLPIGGAASDLVLVTRNVRDFQGLGATIFNPWEPA